MLKRRLGANWRAKEEERRSQEGQLSPVFGVTQAEMSKVFGKLVVALELKKVGMQHMYQLRHGGASMDAASGARSLEGVRRRGRWQSWHS
eukprot:4789374-Heterocapsa_arctica.AAC.1